jgi:hypothetical protein
VDKKRITIYLSTACELSGELFTVDPSIAWPRSTVFEKAKALIRIDKMALSTKMGVLYYDNYLF